MKLFDSVFRKGKFESWYRDSEGRGLCFETIERWFRGPVAGVRVEAFDARMNSSHKLLPYTDLSDGMREVKVRGIEESILCGTTRQLALDLIRERGDVWVRLTEVSADRWGWK